MGYPTSAAATYRSRSATGLSDVAAGSLSELVSGAVAPSEADDWISSLMKKSVEEVTGTSEVVESWIDDILEQPFREVIDEFPEELVDDLPASRGVAPWVGPGLAALGRASNTLGALQLANWVAREVHEWNEMRKLANAKTGTEDWVFPDPADYTEGSFVTYCTDTEIMGGPFPQVGICGVIGSIDVDTQTQVGYGYGQYPAYPGQPPAEWPFYMDRVQYSMVEWFSPPSDNTLPAVRVRLYTQPPLWEIPQGSEPAPTDSSAPWWPQAPSAGGAGEGPAPSLPSMLDPESLPVTSSQPRGTPAPPTYGAIPYVPEDPTRPPNQRSRRGYVWPLPDNWPMPVRPPWDEPDWRKRRREIPAWWWKVKPEPSPEPVPPAGPPPPAGWGERPPGPGTKERKAKLVGKWWWFALRGALAVTEADDLVDAWWNALPARFKTPGATSAEKWADLYRNWDQVSVEVGVENTIINAVEDVVIGAVEGAISKAQRQGVRPDWTNNPTKPEFEEELAQRVNDLVEGPIRDAVPPGLQWPGT